ncbi:heme exporter protein CcmD [Litoreibacter roseus]|uniref:Heme exporter protein D n=1 Tax=Litoreibacter roseus TaxID=2601869 RepID=A0A6N6JCT8_9RHOB|nr:hypothetical protein KIN_07140 [Litoreibacter roseus]
MSSLMPDLGKYAGTVLSSYAASIALVVILVALSLWRARLVQRQLADAETAYARTQAGNKTAEHETAAKKKTTAAAGSANDAVAPQ